MTEVPALAGSRLLAACWRDLAGWQPIRLWHATLLCYQVEALFAVARPTPLGPLHRSLLLALTSDAAALHSLHIDRHLQDACLRELCLAGFVQKSSQGYHEVTPAGHRALATGLGAYVERSRRALSFLDNGSLGRPPHYLHLELPPGPAPASTVGPTFDPCHLRHAIEASSDWKARHGFPSEILAISGVNPGDAPADWRRVIVARPEQRRFVLAEVPDKKSGLVLCGFLIDHLTEQLRADRPAFRLEACRHEVFPDLEIEPPAQTGRLARIELVES